MKQAIVTVATFGKESIDKNGKQAVILLPVAGKIPNRNVLAGTTAERSGFETGKSYLTSVRETEASDEFGRQFAWTKICEVTSPLEIIKSTELLGEGGIYEVEDTEQSVETNASKKNEVLAK